MCAQHAPTYAPICRACMMRALVCVARASARAHVSVCVVSVRVWVWVCEWVCEWVCVSVCECVCVCSRGARVHRHKSTSLLGNQPGEARQPPVRIVRSPRGTRGTRGGGALPLSGGGSAPPAMEPCSAAAGSFYAVLGLGRGASGEEAAAS